MSNPALEIRTQNAKARLGAELRQLRVVGLVGAQAEIYVALQETAEPGLSANAVIAATGMNARTFRVAIWRLERKGFVSSRLGPKVGRRRYRVYFGIRVQGARAPVVVPPPRVTPPPDAEPEATGPRALYLAERAKRQHRLTATSRAIAETRVLLNIDEAPAKPEGRPSLIRDPRFRARFIEAYHATRTIQACADATGVCTKTVRDYMRVLKLPTKARAPRVRCA